MCSLFHLSNIVGQSTHHFTWPRWSIVSLHVCSFEGSNPAEDNEFVTAIKSAAFFPSEVSKDGGHMS
jgi:hypothetical protein